MKKIVKLTESDLVRIVKRVISEQDGDVGKVKDLGNNKYEVRSFGESPDTAFAKKLAIQNASNYILKHLNTSGVTLTNSLITDEKLFKEGNKYKYYLTYTTNVNKG